MTSTPGGLPVLAFAAAIQHGDAEHREWIMLAAVQFVLDGTVPPPKGRGTKLTLLRECLNVIEDVECELGQDEVAELVSMALDRKVERVLKNLREYLTDAEA